MIPEKKMIMKDHTEKIGVWVDILQPKFKGKTYEIRTNNQLLMKVKGKFVKEVQK